LSGAIAQIAPDKALAYQESGMDAHRPVQAEQNRRQRFKERARMEYVAGAEEEWRRRTGRPMAAAELERVIRRYPGDA